MAMSHDSSMDDACPDTLYSITPVPSEGVSHNSKGWLLPSCPAGVASQENLVSNGTSFCVKQNHLCQQLLYSLSSQSYSPSLKPWHEGQEKGSRR